MKEIHGELWDHYGKTNTIILITTNGTVTKDGRAVMGRGCAKEAKMRVPGIDLDLGRKITSEGNEVHSLAEGRIYSFPVKHNWYEDADPGLIAKSACQLTFMAYKAPATEFILPRPGCGNGHLLWQDVKAVIVDLLPDNVLVISK